MFSSLQDWTLDLCVQHVLNWLFYMEESELLHKKIEQFSLLGLSM
jgi:hypothetical protein